MIEFKASEPLSIGLELELQLLDERTLDLADGILPLMELFPGSEHVKPEFIQNAVEIASKPCASIAELESHVASLVSELEAKCQALGMALCGAGSHPFCERLALITPMPRYLNMERRYGYLSHTQITFATHVHIGVRSGDEAVAIMRALKAYLPLVIALSANSPFWRGYDTGHASYRHRILAARRSYGIPPSFESWQSFSNFMASSVRADVFENIHDVHWDVRPRPHLGTVEVRAMDAQSTVAEAVMLAGFVRALVAFLMRTMGSPVSDLPQPLPWWIEKDNHFQASLLGMDARYVHDERGTVVPLAEVWEKTAAAIQSTAEDLGEATYIDRLRRAVAGNKIGYMRQREVHDETGSFKQVVSSLVAELRHEAAATVVPLGSL